jgi:Low psii accumulation1 / Rep27
MVGEPFADESALRSAHIHWTDRPMSDLRQTNPDKYAALIAEAQAPFRSFRMFIYASCVASAGIGGLVIFFGILAGRDLETAIPNFAVNAGVVALTSWLFLRDNKARRQAIAQVQTAMKTGSEKDFVQKKSKK